MFDSVLEDLKYAIRTGNMVVRLILLNIAIFLVLNIVKLFFSDSFFSALKYKLSLLSDLGESLFQPWALITHMFVHISFWHLLWNMLLFYWFGKIVGDLLGDKKILPLYISSGLFGALIFLLWITIFSSESLIPAYGASGAVMAFVFTAASLSPDGEMRLILIGNVRLKYIALGIIILDLVLNAANSPLSFIVHLAGAVFGVLFVVMLRKGTDITNPFSRQNLPEKKRPKTEREKFRVVHNKKVVENIPQNESSHSDQNELDRILDKINNQGMEKLTKIEKDFLKKMSKD